MSILLKQRMNGVNLFAIHFALATLKTQLKKLTLKTFLAILLTFVLIGNSYSQNTDSLKAAADSAVKVFTWDIQKAERGSLMFLDVPYQRDNSDSTEYLTLTVAKDKTKQRPEFISIIIPSNVVRSNGLFVKFANSVIKNGERKIELEQGNPVRILFEKCNDETCTARIINGYASHDNGEKEDVFQKFLDFDHVLFLFIYSDGSHKSVAVPLFSFKQQYKTL